MKPIQKKVWSILLTIALLFTMLPATANAQEENTTEGSANTVVESTLPTTQTETTVQVPTEVTPEASNPVDETSSQPQAQTATLGDTSNAEETPALEESPNLTEIPATTTSAFTSYLDADEIVQPVEATVIDATTTTLSDSETNGYYVVNGSLTLNQTLYISGDVSLILADNADLTVIGDLDHAALEVTQGNTLSIYSQSMGTGKLTVTGGTNGAGIGGNTNSDTTPDGGLGTIQIYGGDIRATGGASGAGIGSGSGNILGGGGVITINGGTIKALGGYNASGIGEGRSGFGTINILGGTIQAFRGNSASIDIGGYSKVGHCITINGGTIFGAESNGSPDLIIGNPGYTSDASTIINGGSVRIKGNYGSIKNSANQDVYSNVFLLSNQINQSVDTMNFNDIPAATIPDASNGIYGIKDVSTNSSGKLYFFLPKTDSIKTISITLNTGNEYWDVYKESTHNPFLPLTEITTPAIWPGNGDFEDFQPEDIELVKNDFGNTLTGIYNGNIPLTAGVDYTLSGNSVTIKQAYLMTLSGSNAILTFDYGQGENNPYLSLSLYHRPEYLAFGDSIVSGYGLSNPTAESYPALVNANWNLKYINAGINGFDSDTFLSSLNTPGPLTALSDLKVITLSIGSNDVLSPFLALIAGNELGSLSDVADIHGKMSILANTDPTAFNTYLAKLDAKDGTGLSNNLELQNSALGFATNFNQIISKLKSYFPNAKIYVTNIYNPYEGISIPYSGGTLDLGAITDTYVQTLNSAFDKNSTDYTLIDTYSAFSASLANGTSLVNANLASFNFDPHPSAAGHSKIAELILASANSGGTDSTINVDSVSLNQNELNLTKNETKTLTATILPANASNKTITWSSSNASVASVDSTGKVTALTPGSAVITVTTQDKNKIATCNVNVKEAETVTPPKQVTPILVNQVKLNTANITLAKKATLTLSTTISPDNAGNKNISWSSSDTNVATVSSTGTITAIAAGTATITATAQDGSNTTATCTVTVPKNTSYSIKYKLNKGTNADTNPTYYAAGIKLKLANPTRKNYTFKGWYLNDNKISAISKSTKGNITLTAKWEKVTIAKTIVKSVKNNKTNAATVSFDKVSGAKGYEVLYSTNKKFTENTTTIGIKKTSSSITNLEKGIKYYVKVRAYKLDSTGNKVYGKYSTVKNVTVKK